MGIQVIATLAFGWKLQEDWSTPYPWIGSMVKEDLFTNFDENVRDDYAATHSNPDLKGVIVQFGSRDTSTYILTLRDAIWNGDDDYTATVEAPTHDRLWDWTARLNEVAKELGMAPPGPPGLLLSAWMG